MVLPITTLATIVLAALYVALTTAVFGARSKTGISLGDGDNEMLMRRNRGQGNFVENVPITLLVLLVAEMQTVGLWPDTFRIALAILAAAFVVGRILHGIAFGFTDYWRFGRGAGMALSYFSTIALIVLAIFAVLV
ncbi:MAG: MAPEG family protein [Pseudomonadota bacterium]